MIKDFLAYLTDIDIVNISRNDLRIIVHGTLETAYSDEDISYHEKTFIKEVMQATNLTDAEKDRVKKDLAISSKQMLKKISSLDAKKLYFLVTCGIIVSDDNIDEGEIVLCNELSLLLGIEKPDFTQLGGSIVQERAIHILTEIRKKFDAMLSNK